ADFWHVLPLWYERPPSGLPRFRPVGAVFRPRVLPDDVDAHGPRVRVDRLDGGVERLAVEIGQLRLRDLLDLLPGHGADLVLVRLRRSLAEVVGALQEDGRGRRLRDEGIGPIRVDGDDDGDDEPFVLARLRVEV